MTRQYKGHSKTIKSLAGKAEKGVLVAQFQLHEYYDKGKYVDRDEAQSQKYLKMLEDSLIGKSIRLKSLSLSNFRRFHSLDIDFDEKITVIIGDNGAGKTSFAEAMSKIFSWFNNNLEKDDVNGKPITVSDINVSATDYAEVTGRLQLDKVNMFDASLVRTFPGFAGSLSSEVSTIKQFGAMYRKAANNTKIMIPLLAFYSVDRSSFSLKQEVSERISGEATNNRFSALKDALEGSGRLDSFSELYIELVNLAEGEETKEVKNLRAQVATLERSIAEVYEGTLPPSGDPFLARLNSKREELASTLSSVRSAKHQRHLSLVHRAIETLVPGVKNLEIDRSSGKARLLVENFGNKVNITQLSQGQKMLVALAGDLARRLVTLNPEADEPLNCHGIVIIDEVELHLHPKWQQEILLGIQRTFPNIQFIVTTHSPQILSTVDNKCIRQICLDEEGSLTINTPSFQTKGVASADILARIMGTNSVPEKLEEAIWVSKYYECLNNNDDKGADRYFDLILSHFGVGHPVVLDCESQRRIIEMRIRLAKDNA